MPNARTTEQPTTNRQKKVTLDCKIDNKINDFRTVHRQHK